MRALGGNMIGLVFFSNLLQEVLDALRLDSLSGACLELFFFEFLRQEIRQLFNMINDDMGECILIFRRQLG